MGATAMKMILLQVQGIDENYMYKEISENEILYRVRSLSSVKANAARLQWKGVIHRRRFKRPDWLNSS